MNSIPAKSSILKIVVPCLILVLALASCKKDKKKTTPGPTTGTGTRSELTKDSIFLYAKQVYYWYDALPTYEAFNPRKFTSSSDELTNFNSELYAITQYKINPLTSQPYEYSGTAGKAKYSYIQDRTTKNPIAYIPSAQSAVDLEGNGNDMGFALTGLYRDASSTSYDLYIRFVTQGSPADKAGLKRGNLLTKLNGQSFGASFSAEVAAVNNAMAQSTLAVTRKNGDGTETTFNLTKAVYKSSPIFNTRVIDTLGKKIGYLAYARFSTMENSSGELLQAFDAFSAAGVNNLVIDLRYNGGGYVNTSEYLANLIAPASKTGSLMFTEYYNLLMQTKAATILTNQPLLDGNNKLQYSNGRIVTYADIDFSPAKYTYKFSKKGSLENITNVVFIVTGSTASASELLINNLKPYMNVKLVGAQSYGKPIGFFPVTIDKYDVYYSMFQSKNSAGEGEYFAGFTPDKTTFDDVTRDFGSSKESSLAAAIAWITKGTFTVSSSGKETTVSGTPITPATRSEIIASPGEFKGAIETRFILKGN